MVIIIRLLPIELRHENAFCRVEKYFTLRKLYFSKTKSPQINQKYFKLEESIKGNPN